MLRAHETKSFICATFRSSDPFFQFLCICSWFNKLLQRLAACLLGCGKVLSHSINKLGTLCCKQRLSLSNRRQKELANIYDGIGESGLRLRRHARLLCPFVGIDMALKSRHQLRLAMLSYDGLAGHGNTHSWICEPFWLMIYCE